MRLPPRLAPQPPPPRFPTPSTPAATGGIGFDIDGASAQKLELQTCDRGGCYASGPLTAEVLSAMQNGQKLNIVFQNMQKQPITLPMSLIGFTAAYQKLN